MTAMPIFHTAHLRVRKDVIDRFRERLLRHARMSHDAEPGCHRFEVHQETNDPTLFLLIEIYADKIAFEAHRSSAHYLAFREDVRDWVTERTWWHWTKLESE
jgi:autoinducer 2-degrading protein